MLGSERNKCRRKSRKMFALGKSNTIRTQEWTEVRKQKVLMELLQKKTKQR